MAHPEWPSARRVQEYCSIGGAFMSSVRRSGIRALFSVAVSLVTLSVSLQPALATTLVITVSDFRATDGNRDRVQVDAQPLGPSPPAQKTEPLFKDAGDYIEDEVGFWVFSGSWQFTGNPDPWVAYRYSFTNDDDTPLEFFFSLAMPLEPRLGGPIVHQSVMDVLVLDSDGDGDGSFTSINARNRVSVLDIDFSTNPPTVVDDQVILPGAGPIDDIFASDGWVNVINEPLGPFDLPGELEDSGAETVEDSFFTVGGVLSPGDSFIIDGFTCFSSSSEDCPARPDLGPVIPVPAAVWLFGSAIGLLGLTRRKSN